MVGKGLGNGKRADCEVGVGERWWVGEEERGGWGEGGGGCRGMVKRKQIKGEGCRGRGQILRSVKFF